MCLGKNSDNNKFAFERAGLETSGGKVMSTL